MLLYRGEPYETYAAEVNDKSAEEVETYYHVFEEKWETLSGMILSSP